MASKKPRAAASYRGARRNAVLRGDVKGTWRGVEAQYRPYLVKPPILKFVPRDGLNFRSGAVLTSIRERTQPTIHPYSSRRQDMRAARRRGRTMEAAA